MKKVLSMMIVVILLTGMFSNAYAETKRVFYVLPDSSILICHAFSGLSRSESYDIPPTNCPLLSCGQQNVLD